MMLADHVGSYPVMTMPGESGNRSHAGTPPTFFDDGHVDATGMLRNKIIEAKKEETKREEKRKIAAAAKRDRAAAKRNRAAALAALERARVTDEERAAWARRRRVVHDEQAARNRESVAGARTTGLKSRAPRSA